MDTGRTPLPGIADIRAAAARLEGLIVNTGLIESEFLNEKYGARILFKPENLQRTGSFKIRGAYNKISSLPDEQRRNGVVAFSSGNHAQGVARTAQLFGIKAVIAMPSDAPFSKVDNVRRMGAEVIPFDRFGADRMAVVAPYRERGMALVPPFDDPAIIAGQGTIGLEVLEDARQKSVHIDAVIVPCGGGGMIGGISLAMKDGSPDSEIWAAEPENFDDMRRSLEAGRRMSNLPGHASICDAILTAEPGEFTFEINRHTLAGGIAVSDDATIEAMRDLASALKLVVEPGGAVGLAALGSGQVDFAGKCVVVVLSGGNVDLGSYAKIIAKS
ncbi:pyridoxal-phosphate dependent enzyme [Mesorhizobium sp. NBSH29]|nr:threonine/serine dehydratase [Mesorhizobium sp. NBSH29]QPC88582.1 pyridoxal-phosphate dependent enzyme [Mesorhizobium sp. NBSH29]